MRDTAREAFAGLPHEAQRALVGASFAGARCWVGADVAHVVLIDVLLPEDRDDLLDELTAAGYITGWLHTGTNCVDAHWCWSRDDVLIAPVYGVSIELDSWIACDDARELLRRIVQGDQREGVRAACLCAREIMRYLPEGELRPLRAIEAAEAWTRGEATLAEVQAAREDTWAAYSALALANDVGAFSASAATSAAAACALATAFAAADCALATAFATAASAYLYCDPRRRVLVRAELARLADLVRMHHREPRS